MRIGFTGTRQGMTAKQKLAFVEFLEAHEREVKAFHHGDCVGADAEAHDLFVEFFDGAAMVVIHPPTISDHRAFRTAPSVMRPRPYLERDHFIVDACDVLLAAPKSMKEELRSGTWATVRYARKIGRPVVMLER